MRSPVHVRLSADAPSLAGVTQFHCEVEDGLPRQVYDRKVAAALRVLDRLNFCQCIIFCNLRAKAAVLAETVRFLFHKNMLYPLRGLFIPLSRAVSSHLRIPKPATCAYSNPRVCVCAVSIMPTICKLLQKE